MNIKTSFLTFFSVVLISSFSARAGVTILNGLTHVYNSEKGTVINGEIIIKNTSTTNDERVVIYMNDMLQNCNDETNYFDTGELLTSLGDWVTLSTPERVLTPEEEFTLSYTLTVPETVDGVTLDEGSFWGVVMIEVAKPINEETQRGVQINSKIRYGIQLIVNLGEKVESELEFVNVAFNKTDEAYTMDIKIENKGEFIVQPTLILELFDEAGESVKKSEAVFKRVYPKACKNFTIEIDGVPPGLYDGVLVADYGGEIYGVNLGVEISE